MLEQLERLRRAATLIHERFPESTTFDLQTSDQSHYGFILGGINLRDGETVDPVDIDPILDDLDSLLNDLDWDAVVGEDRGGYVTLPVHAQALPVESVRTVVRVELGDYTHHQGSPYGPKDVKRAEARIRKALTELRLHVLDVRKEKGDFRVEILEPRRSLHAVASEVRHVVRGAMRELCPHMTLRVTARKLAPGRTARTFQDARAHENEVTVTVTIE